MKKKDLTKEELKKLFSAINHGDRNVVGFLNKVPVISNKNVPDGEVWIASEKEFKKILL